jgi:hypothetical protein
MGQGADMSDERTPEEKPSESGWRIVIKVLLFFGIPFLLMYLMKTAMP